MISGANLSNFGPMQSGHVAFVVSILDNKSYIYSRNVKISIRLYFSMFSAYQCLIIEGVFFRFAATMPKYLLNKLAISWS